MHRYVYVSPMFRSCKLILHMACILYGERLTVSVDSTKIHICLQVLEGCHSDSMLQRAQCLWISERILFESIQMSTLVIRLSVLAYDRT